MSQWKMREGKRKGRRMNVEKNYFVGIGVLISP
jgi:hypothetical protein